MLVRGDAKFVENESNNGPLQSYYDASKKQQSNLISAYEAILKQAGNKDVLFVIIHLIKILLDGKANRNSYQKSYWYQSFLSFKNRNEQHVEILDLMKYLPTKLENFFLECDGHWSARGNAWVSKVIMKFIRTKNLFELNR